jgi:hypothetical protein
MRYVLFIFSAVLFLVLQMEGGLTLYESLSIALSMYFFLNFLWELGSKIVIFDLTILMAFLTCLIMPIIFYHFYTKDNPLAVLWVKYMPISSDDYFSFAVPGVIALALGLKIPVRKLKINRNPALYIENVKEYLNRHPQLGFYLVGIGFASGLLNFLASAGLKEIFFLTAHLVFVGVFYVIYSPNKKKNLVVPGVVLLMIGESMLTGMFGELVFILALSIILLLLGKKISFPKKLGFALLGIFLIILIQSVKGDYRRKSWTQGGADPSYFAELIVDRVATPSSMFDPMDLFMTSVRMNQGWLVAETMKMVPARYSFGNGEPLAAAVAASIVPRFVWPDKPEAGGKANLKRFWGFDLVGWSTNIGTLGEAYANFGRNGGLAYLFFYGLFFNLMLAAILKMAEKRPTLVLWLPFLFFSVINVETDLLSTMGALVKSLIFMWIVFRVFQSGFRMDL